MNKTLTWLHLSDLHLCSAKTNWEIDNKKIIKKLKDDLAVMQNDHQLEPDLLFFTGDLALGHSGDGGLSLKVQFEEVNEFINSICKLFNLSPEQVFIVPGNHDINRTLIEDSSRRYLEDIAKKNYDESILTVNGTLNSADLNCKNLMEGLSDYRTFLKNGYKHLLESEDHLTYSKEITAQSGIKVGILGLNSAWCCGISGKSEKGNLWIGGEWQISTANSKLEQSDIKIVLAHHPLTWLVPQENPTIDRILEREFDFFLHGHEHKSWIDVKTDNQFIGIAAAACNSKNPLEIGYSFVRLNFTDGYGEVWLRKFDDLGFGWIPRIIYGKTNNDGLWKLNDLHWLKKPNVDDEIEPINTALETNVISDDISQHSNNQIETKASETDVSPILPISNIINKYPNSPALAIFNLFGSFDENNQADTEIINQLI